MFQLYQGTGVQIVKYGDLIRETHTVPTRHGAITEEQAICFFDRSSMFSQYIDAKDVDESLVRMYAYPADAIDPDTGHLATGAWDASAAREWVMVYRYYPKPDSGQRGSFHLS
jgi:hypothetical protein